MKKLKEKKPFYASIFKKNFIKSGQKVKINKFTLGIELEVCYLIKKSFFHSKELINMKKLGKKTTIQSNEERIEIVLSSLNTGLALINPDLTVDWVNEVTQSILPWEDLIGKVCYEVAAKRDEPCEGCGALMAFSDGETHETERQSPVDGRWHFIVSIPIKNDSGRVVKVLESVTDITDRKNTEIQRQSQLGLRQMGKRTWILLF